MTSPQKRRANRLNAQRSSGPKTIEGRTISALNALRHGLSKPLEFSTNDPAITRLTELLMHEGLESSQAHDLVVKMVDYERNLSYQAKMFLRLQEFEFDLSPEDVQTRFRDECPEIDMLDEMVQEEFFLKGRVKARDLKWAARSKEALQRSWLRLHMSRVRRAQRDAKNSLRYLRRSSNQLIKSFRSLPKV